TASRADARRQQSDVLYRTAHDPARDRPLVSRRQSHRRQQRAARKDWRVIQLLRTHLRAYRSWLIAVLVLQGVQAAASLLLPSLNADIIDKGVLRGDTGYIWRIGAIMLAVTAVQAVFSVSAVYFASRTAMGFGRD